MQDTRPVNGVLETSVVRQKYVTQIITGSPGTTEKLLNKKSVGKLAGVGVRHPTEVVEWSE